MANIFAAFGRRSRVWRSQAAEISVFRTLSRAEARHHHLLSWRKDSISKLYDSSSLRYLSANFPRDVGFHRFNTTSSKSSDTKRALRQKIWRVLRVLFILTGGAVWSLPALIYLGYLTGFIEIDMKDKEGDVRRLGSEEYNNRMLMFYDVSKQVEGEERAREVGDKQFALMQIWNKLRTEDGVVRKFGTPVQLSGFQVMANTIADQLFGSEEKSTAGTDDAELIEDSQESDTDRNPTSDTNNWTASCYVEGPKLTGVLQVDFDKANAEWVPVSLHLETIQKTGDVICNVSGPLPNGISRFTRLSDD